jgi:hypothetical protein
MKPLLLTVAAMLLVSGSRVLAHHGPYGQFSLEERIDFAGTVVAVEWTNPHAFVLVSTEVDGNEVVFRIELESLRQLGNKGWWGDELAIGEQVRIVNAALELTEGSKLICCARIYGLDGKEYFTNPRSG